MAPLTSPNVGVIAVLLTVVGCGAIPQMPVSRADFLVRANPVFRTDELKSPFRNLAQRGCLPDDFNFSGSTSVADQCAAKVKAGDVGSECAAAPAFAQYCSCLANSLGYVTDSGFNPDALQNHLLSFTNDPTWRSAEINMMNMCKRMSWAPLTPQQQAVYTYLCVEWKLFAGCDLQQSMEGSLDEEGMLVQSRFLAGDCPFSPTILLDSFGLVTGRTWAECSQGIYSGDDASQRYASEVSRIACLLQDFNDANGNLDYDKLKSAIQAVDFLDGPASTDLLWLLDDCTGRNSFVPPGPPEVAARVAAPVTAEQFAKCWGTRGAFSCAHQEADGVASMFPESCVITL